MENPYAKYAQPQQGPISSGFKPEEEYKRSAEQRAQEDQRMQAERDRLAREQAELTGERDRIKLDQERLKNAATGGVDASVEQGKAATFALRAQRANEAISSAKLDPDSMVGKFGYSVAPDITAAFSSDDRNAQRARESDFIAAVLRYESGAAIPPSEFDTAYKIYFPSSNAGPKEIEAKRQARANAIEGLRLGAGPNVLRIDGAQTASGGVPENADLVGSTSAPAGDRPDDLPPDAKEVVRDSAGNVVGYIGADGEFVTTFRTQERQAYDERVKQAAQDQGGYTERANQGITLGLSDEVAGVGGAIGSLLRGDNPVTGYQFSRDVQRFRNEQADERTGLLGDAVEIGSSLFLPFGAARTTGQAAKIGAMAGGIGGFGYGEGAQGSATGLGVGALAGGTLGYGLAKGTNALLNRQAARQISGNNTNALLQAGAQEGVTVNRAMANPELQPRVTGVSGTMAGSRSIERNMGEIGGQIEGRVADLGVNGTALTNEVGGGKVRAIAERQIKKSGKAAKKIYDRAEQASSGVKITPSESIARVDEVSKKLSETPATNKAELEYLKTLKADLSKDLSVGGLRRLRTKLRKSISKGDLVFGENEADVLSIMDSASLDIANGLRAQGKGGAAKLFEEADSLYRERAKYIEGTLQKLIGKRNSNTSDQQVFSKFKSLADPKGDGPAMERFMSEMSPDEVADVAATFAEDLGRNTKKEFSTAFLVTQAEKLRENPTALKAIFGDAGAKSLDNLIILSKEHNRVTNAARGSQTGLRADYRSWLTNAIFTGGAGLTAGLTQGAGTAALAATATAATVGAAKLGKDALSARLLMSPKVTGWLRSAPKTTSPAAINKHWAKLGAIAKAEPALAAEIDAFRNAVLGAANDNAQRAVAQDRQD